MSVKDINGVTLEVGQVVVTNPPNYKGLEIAVVVNVTPKGATVTSGLYFSEASKRWSWAWSYSRPSDWLCVLEWDENEPSPNRGDDK